MTVKESNVTELADLLRAELDLVREGQVQAVRRSVRAADARDSARAIPACH